MKKLNIYGAILGITVLFVVLAVVMGNLTLPAWAYTAKIPPESSMIQYTQSCVMPVASHLEELWKQKCVLYAGELSTKTSYKHLVKTSSIVPTEMVTGTIPTESQAQTPPTEFTETPQPEATETVSTPPSAVPSKDCKNKNAGKDGTPSECNAGGGQEKK